MRNLRFTLAGLALLLGLTVWLGAGDGRAQDPSKPQWLQHFYGSQPAAAVAPVVRGSLPEVETNEEFQVKPEHGPWMVSIISYSGPDAAKMANEMVKELRGPNYNLPAYVFNSGAEKRRAERKRVEELIRKQREFLKEQNQEAGIPIRVKTVRIEEQCAVVVGGYNDLDTARRALDEMKYKLKPPDPSRVKLQMAFRFREGESAADKGEGEISLSNPFKHSFVVHNPSMASEAGPERNKLDMTVLRKLNRGEDYCLLNCSKPFTLAVAGYSVPTRILQQNAPNTFWDKIGVSKNKDYEDAAAHAAHSLADNARKLWNLEAYVLHTQFSSIVTVGSYDSPNDSRLKKMQEWFSRMSALPQMQQFQFFADPKPMQVPREFVQGSGGLVPWGRLCQETLTMNERLPTIYLARHGETAWTVSGQHTGRTDIPLTERGERSAEQLGERLKGPTFDPVFTSPLQRARRTCDLAGFGVRAVVDPDLVEWDYGQYEGKTTAAIHGERPDWQLFRDGCPGGESVAEIGARADRVLVRLRACAGDVLCFSSGHFLRVLTARWLGLEPSGGRFFFLGTATLSVLGYEHNKGEPVLRLWNDTGHSGT